MAGSNLVVRVFTSAGCRNCSSGRPTKDSCIHHTRSNQVKLIRNKESHRERKIETDKIILIHKDKHF